MVMDGHLERRRLRRSTRRGAMVIPRIDMAVRFENPSNGKSARPRVWKIIPRSFNRGNFADAESAIWYGCIGETKKLQQWAAVQKGREDPTRWNAPHALHLSKRLDSGS